MRTLISFLVERPGRSLASRSRMLLAVLSLALIVIGCDGGNGGGGGIY